LLSPALTESDVVKGDRTETTTRQVRKRTRLGGDGRDVVEEEQEVVVRTTGVRWTGAAETQQQRDVATTKGDDRVEDKGTRKQGETVAVQPVEHVIDDKLLETDVHPEEAMQVDV
jgi:hypothetical protein